MKRFAAACAVVALLFVCSDNAEAQITISKFGRNGGFSLSFGNGGFYPSYGGYGGYGGYRSYGLPGVGGGNYNSSYDRNRFGSGAYYNRSFNRGNYGGGSFYSPGVRSPWGGYENNSYNRNR